MFVRQTSGGEGGDRIRAFRRRPLRVSHTPVTDVRVYGELHTQAQTFAGEIYDEQCVGELYYTAGGVKPRYARDIIMCRVCV